MILKVKYNGIMYEQTFTGTNLVPVYNYLNNMGRMKELFIEQMREGESKKALYPDQDVYSNDLKCANCSSQDLGQKDSYTYFCSHCGCTNVKVNDKLILE
jgi:hypothetical protein